MYVTGIEVIPVTLPVEKKIRMILAIQDKTISELAGATDQSLQNLSKKMRRGNFSEKDISLLAEALGCTVDIVFTLPDGTQI